MRIRENVCAGLVALSCLVPIEAGAEEPASSGPKVFLAGAAVVDVSPTTLPVIINGGFLEAKADTVNDPLSARALVLDDGVTRLAIVVVDSCGLPRELVDVAKERAKKTTGIPTDRMLVSATHTHSAPSSIPALGSRADPEYIKHLPGWIAEAIEKAARNLAPARIGWSSVDDFEHTHCRRWIYRADKMLTDPFGLRTVRANMHPGYQNPDTVGPAGPVDPELSVLSVQGLDDRPIALLANYSMHYFGAKAVSADYYGKFVRLMESKIGANEGGPPFVAIMSQGTSGDQHWMDYGRPKSDLTLDTYAEAVARVAYLAYKTVTHREWVPLAMAETRLTLRRRTPDEERLAWARRVAAEIGDRRPKTIPEVYALEQISLHEQPERELKLQTIRIGDLGIAAIPDEVYALTGLKIKAQSPLPATFNIALANGFEGYIPPPAQHKLGGYTTWPARSAALEVQAEPKIVETVLDLLEKASGKPRRAPRDEHGPYARLVLAAKPLAYWRLNELDGPKALDATGNGQNGQYEDGIAFALPGPESSGFSGPDAINRAPHFAGGRLTASPKGLGKSYSVELWFWNGLPDDARAVTSPLLSRGGDRLAIGGTESTPGRLVFGDGHRTQVGGARIARRTWNHVVLSRDGKEVAVYLNGRAEPELRAEAEAGTPPGAETLWIGGREDGREGFEGKIDEVSVYDRALSAAEAAGHFSASGPSSVEGGKTAP